MTAGETQDLGPPHGAKEAFAEYLRRKDAGEDVDFEKFCSERAEIADALRLLHSVHPGKPQAPPRPAAANDTLPLPALSGEQNPPEDTGREPPEHPDQIGPYRILGVLGEGGMGIVYIAEQKEPVRRRVALKVIKLGMDTKEVVARFEAERQALALMDHPNIATILDGGVTGQVLK